MEKEIKTSLQESEIRESWHWDIDTLREEMNAINRKIRLAEKERKLQPHLFLRSELTGEYYVTNRYQIRDGGVIVVERKRPATEDEIRQLGQGD